MVSISCSSISISILLSSVVCRFISRKVCFFPLVIVIYPNVFLIIFNRLSLTFLSKWDNLLSYTYHTMVHCFPLIVLLAKYLSYSFNFYPSAFNVCVYKLYHCSANSIQPYIALSTLNYSTFWPFSYLTYCLYYSFILHMMSTKWPRSFRITFYSLASRFASTLLECRK